MQRHPSGTGDEGSLVPFPHAMYNSSIPPSPVTQGPYDPYGPQDPSSTWGSYTSPEGYANQEGYAIPQYYPPPSAAAGPSVPPTYTPVPTSPGFAPRQTPYSRPPFPPPSEYPSAPKQSAGDGTEVQDGKEKGTRKKKKRKMTQREGSANSAEGNKDKRTKTGRACDACVSLTCYEPDFSERKRYDAISSLLRGMTDQPIVPIASIKDWSVLSSCP